LQGLLHPCFDANKDWLPFEMAQGKVKWSSIHLPSDFTSQMYRKGLEVLWVTMAFSATGKTNCISYLCLYCKKPTWTSTADFPFFLTWISVFKPTLSGKCT
jgi:hypothetical protein